MEDIRLQFCFDSDLQVVLIVGSLRGFWFRPQSSSVPASALDQLLILLPTLAGTNYADYTSVISLSEISNKVFHDILAVFLAVPVLDGCSFV